MISLPYETNLLVADVGLSILSELEVRFRSMGLESSRTTSFGIEALFVHYSSGFSVFTLLHELWYSILSFIPSFLEYSDILCLVYIWFAYLP